ncbi:hypothetical protein [Prevotella pallens]|uniref:hypothetical protein n=1 Tax=Prevotella pallens TaxID=60133 RepID=UPI00288BE2EB|nr:hypothetical protein [Prevotella pallens]
MNENKKRKDYLQPDVAILSIDEESHLLAESPLVRPGGGGSGSQTPGTIIVVPHISDDSNPDDDLEG